MDKKTSYLKLILFLLQMDSRNCNNLVWDSVVSIYRC